MSKLYVIVRNDLPSMNYGKMMAQVCHAGTQFIINNKTESSVKSWSKEADGFGTTIVLSANEEQINKLKQKYKLFDIIDPTYPFNCQWELLKYIPNKVMKDNNILVSAYDKPNKFGEVPATRIEHTCSYIFLDNDYYIEEFREYCDEIDVGLF